MKLVYRGIGYDYQPPVVEQKDNGLSGKYRGLDWRFCNSAKSTVQQPTLDLVYRGVAYAPGNAEQPTTRKLVSSLNGDLSRRLVMKHQHAIKLRQQAMLVRLANEVGIEANVGNYWNRIQGKVHPSFRATYERSTAAMS